MVHEIVARARKDGGKGDTFRWKESKSISEKKSRRARRDGRRGGRVEMWLAEGRDDLVGVDLQVMENK